MGGKIDLLILDGVVYLFYISWVEGRAAGHQLVQKCAKAIIIHRKSVAIFG